VKKLIEDKDKLFAMMKQLLIFQNLSDAHIQELFAYCTFLEYSDEEVIVTQDTLSPYLYGILDGKVNVYMRSQENKDVHINAVNCGDVFGEAAIFIDMKRTAKVIADGPVKLLSISREKLIAFLYRFPDAGNKILIFIIFSLIHKLKRSSVDLVFEKESTVTAADLEVLRKFFPPTIEDVINN
jgi:CRP/FNR family transcriptional regulator, cyclic AMP receptor protein